MDEMPEQQRAIIYTSDFEVEEREDGVTIVCDYDSTLAWRNYRKIDEEFFISCIKDLLFWAGLREGKMEVVETNFFALLRRLILEKAGARYCIAYGPKLTDRQNLLLSGWLFADINEEIPELFALIGTGLMQEVNFCVPRITEKEYETLIKESLETDCDKNIVCAVYKEYEKAKEQYNAKTN